MPIVGVKPIDNTLYKFSINTGYNRFEDITVSPNGFYNVYYIKDGTYLSCIGKITRVVIDSVHSCNSYLVFDRSQDNNNRKERINLYKIQNIIDVTPTNSYQIAVENGFKGDVEEWLKSLEGKSAYQIAVENGFDGTEKEWLDSLQAISNYQIAVKNGFTGTEAEWLESLKALSNYQIACDNGFEGTEEEWLNTLKASSNYEIAVDNGFTGTEEEWLSSLVGKSAYDVAVEKGFKGTEEEWLASLRGMSAYDVAVECGFKGTKEEWIASLGFTATMENRIKELEKGLLSANEQADLANRRVADINKRLKNFDHSTLINRDSEDQHTIKSVTGLQEAIDSVPDQIQTISNTKLEELLK